MSLKIYLEIGHEATLRTKNTPEGFTHDWKIFVRGFDGANIHYYVEKVVFYLHETFPKPRRVIKEPPYSVKESGYAGFIVPIEVYLRNSGEPKKIKFSYDLSLQRTGPPLRKVRKEKYIFTSPPEDFKEKLLKGGAVVTSNSQEISENKSILHEEKNQLISKPKLSGELPPKKPKFEPPISNSFQDLFGTPITKTSKVAEPKSALPLPKENKSNIKPEKDKSADKSKSKHSPHKEKEKEKTERKEKRKDKERKDKDRDKSKEKVLKMEKSPKVGPPSPKNPSSKPNSPLPQSVQNTSAEKYREKDGNKNDKDRKDKGDEEEKRNKKEKKDKDSSRDKDKHRECMKGESKNKEIKSKEASLPQESAASSVFSVEPEIPDDKQEKKENRKEDDKSRRDKSEERKHKHKKKDKNRKERKDEDDKSIKVSQKAEKDKTPVNAPLQLIVSNTSSGSLEIDMSETNNLFGNDEKQDPNSSPSPKNNEEPMETYSTLSEGHSNSYSSDASRNSSPMEEDRTNENENDENDSAKKRKRSDDSSDLEESPMKMMREDDLLSGEDEDEEGEDNDEDEGNDEMVEEEERPDSEDDSDDSSGELEIDMNNKYKIHTDDEACSNESLQERDPERYNLLCDLRERFLLITDDDMLQEIVEVISDTGLYALSNTFDFDLSELDQDTIRRLQEILPELPPSTE